MLKKIVRILPCLPLLTFLTAQAQDSTAVGRCAAPDTIVFRGATRTSDAALRLVVYLLGLGIVVDSRNR